MRDYISAGFDPAGFWSLTPREYDLHIAGAVQRERHALARLARGVWVGVHARGDDLERFVADLTGTESVLPEEALEAVLAAKSAALPEMSWEDLRKRMH